MEDGGSLHDPPSSTGPEIKLQMGEDPSLRLLLIPPPIHVEDPEPPPPESILLDPYGYLSDRTNATTADGRRSRRSGRRILVTFWAATPPRVSCFTVHCPGLEPSAFGDIPKVLCAEDDLALLRVAICPEGEHLYAQNNRYFVYKAGAENRPPSLKRVRTPPGLELYGNEAVLLRCRDRDTSFLAALRSASIYWKYAKKQFNLHLYSSRTGGVEHQVDERDRHRRGARLGGLGRPPAGHPHLRPSPGQLPQPPLHPTGVAAVARAAQGLPQSPCTFGTSSSSKVTSGTSRCTSTWRPCSDAECTGTVAEGWVAATRKMEASNVGTGSSWEEDCTVKFHEVPVDGPAYAEMLPDLQQGQDAELTLKSVHAGYPALSLHDGDVVHIMHMPDHGVDKASVIAV
ncbi:hypothetical protein GQ55_2G327200 [Panicum hallii var. hallii]|uniref:DUF1618 domain-containing protein n=1 Tax=Panicum hallii var. hallii TaxID=1504633 RepID=A0A2T7EUV5_9POAL|nr:hypothetical protein GQ55_2G327200 [Panicum hallii var. hallii]